MHTQLGNWDSWLVVVPDLRPKGCKFRSQQKRRENDLLPSQLCVPTLIRCLFHPRVTSVAHKRPWSLCQKYRWEVTSQHAYTFDPMKSEWADYPAVQALCGNLSRNELTCNSSGNTQSQLSQLAEPLLTDPGLKSEISVCRLITIKKKTTQVGNEL